MLTRLFSCVLVAALIASGCGDTITYVQDDPDFMRLDEATDPTFAWPGTVVAVTGTDIEADGATFTATVGGLAAEIISVTDERIMLRIPKEATGGGIVITRKLTGESISVSTEVDIVRSPYVLNAFDIRSNGLKARTVWTILESDGPRRVDTVDRLADMFGRRPNSGRSARRYCTEIPSGDTVIVCGHSLSNYVDGDGMFHGNSDEMDKVLAVIDSVRGVVSTLRITMHESKTEQRGMHGVETAQYGTSFELRDAPYTRLPDGTIRIALNATELQQGLMGFRRSSSRLYRDETRWHQEFEESTTLLFDVDASLTLELRYQD